LYSGAKHEKRGLETGFNIIPDILNKEPVQSVGDIFKTCFSEAKCILEEEIIKMTRSVLGLKRKRKAKKRCLSANIGR
jgi:hypothetical protein